MSLEQLSKAELDLLLDIEDNDNSLVYNELMDACARGDLDLVKHIIENSCRVKIKPTSLLRGNDLYFIACKHGHLPVVEYLNEQGIMHASSSQYRLYYIEAVKSGNLELVKYLVETHDIEDTHAALRHACKSSNPLILSYILDHLSQQSGTTDLSKSGFYPDNSLYYNACRSGIEMTNLLIEYGLGPNTNRYSYNYYIQACRSGDLRLVQWFMNHYDDSGDSVIKKETPYSCACQSGSLELVKYLGGHVVISEGTNPQKFYDNAVESGKVELIKYMLSQEMKENYPHLYRQDPLSNNWFQIAISSGNLEMVRYIYSLAPFDKEAHNGHHLIRMAELTDNYEITREVFRIYRTSTKYIASCKRFGTRRDLLLYRRDLKDRAKSARK